MADASATKGEKLSILEELSRDMDSNYEPSSTPSLEDDVHPQTAVSLTKKDCQSTHQDEETKTKVQTKTNSEIIIKAPKNKDRTRTSSRAHFCFYCQKSTLKMPRHLEMQHSDESDVAHAISFPVRSKQRRAIFDTLRHKGNWKHMVKVIKEDGQLLTWNEPSKKASGSEYDPRQYCYAMFKGMHLQGHVKSSQENLNKTPKRTRQSVPKKSFQLLPRTSSEGIVKIIGAKSSLGTGTETGDEGAMATTSTQLAGGH